MTQFWGEYLPNWISATSTALAFVAAGIAAVFAWRSLQRELQRDERSQAMGLSAWWVTGDVDGREAWGIVVSNAADGTFHDIEIQAVGNQNPKAKDPIKITTLPPGRCFVESNAKSDPKPWSRITLVDGQSLRPLSHAVTRNVKRIVFSDASGRRWSWSPEAGLVRTRGI